ncbi:hypothetical protein UCMB321_5582 [Pseudomonas batumici]|uniref:Uncharacterized protein n=1 Tax=Pseudomonas batumici TaxID=226910 RepID=A0A0C2I183_9PSED|nr:hypothetical protein UCMB321_5582 [Pseudomonas batumici]
MAIKRLCCNLQTLGKLNQLAHLERDRDEAFSAIDRSRPYVG